MKRNLLKFVIVGLIACSEPHDFDVGVNTIVNIVDAKISNLAGRSYVEIYRSLNGEKIGIQDLDVSLLTNQGHSIPFTFSAEENLYRPLDPTFVTDGSLEYRMIATGPGEITYESSAERIEPPVTFKFALKDTTVIGAQFDGVTGVERTAKAFVVRLPPMDEKAYLKFDFNYSFADLFTGDTTTRSFLDEFVLFSNVGIAQTNDSIEIPVRSKVFSGWFFTDHSILSIFCGEGECSFEDPCCGNPCCGYSETWPAVYEMVVQSMSSEAYNYWEAVEKLNSNNGLLRDTYPFPLKGNISCSNCINETIGLFRVVTEVSEKMVIEL